MLSRTTLERKKEEITKTFNELRVKVLELSNAEISANQMVESCKNSDFWIKDLAYWELEESNARHSRMMAEDVLYRFVKQHDIVVLNLG